MNEEIKEIIDYLIDEECTRRIKCITIEESKQLLDYITNLQQENERLNNIINELEKYIDDNYFYDDVGMKIFDVSLLEDKIKELKESGNNDK